MQIKDLEHALEQSLKDRDDYIQSAAEEQQSSNEELKSANEELQSINEEMQSTNEELETSKEELQSVNEELATINAELQEKVLDLSRVNNDINNLVAGTGIGTIFVDMELRVLRFTPGATQIIKLIESDVGRPVGDFSSNLIGYDRLEDDLQLVLDTLVPQEEEVRTAKGAYYLMRILPYRTSDQRIEGAVINFVNITERKQVEASLAIANSSLRLAVVVRDAHDAIILQDLEGRILAWNPAAYKMYGWSESEALKLNIRQLIPIELQDGDITTIQTLSRKNAIEPYLTKRLTKRGGSSKYGSPPPCS
jgi:two-component system CheB/CheR fusion protein